MRRLAAALLALCALVTACGARTGLERARRDAGARDAGPPDAGRPDAGTFDAGFNFATFPCRWSVGLPVELARSRGPGAGFLELSGGTLGDASSVLNRAAVTATDAVSGEPVSAVVRTAGRSEILERIALPRRVRFYAGLDAFVGLRQGTCDVELYLLGMVGLRGPFSLGDRGGPPCQLSQIEVGFLEVAQSLPEGVSVRRAQIFERGSPSVTPLLTLRTPSADRVEVVHQPDLGTMVLARRARQSFVERHTEGTAELEGPFSYEEPFSVAPDRLHGGMLLLRPVGGRWLLERFTYGEPLAPIEVLDLRELPAEPIGRLASNETEALIPLADGSMVYVPLALSRIRRVNMEDVSAVAAMEIVIRPGDSSGGLLYVVDEGPQEASLHFRPLTCNR